MLENIRSRSGLFESGINCQLIVCILVFNNDRFKNIIYTIRSRNCRIRLDSYIVCGLSINQRLPCPQPSMAIFINLRSDIGGRLCLSDRSGVWSVREAVGRHRQRIACLRFLRNEGWLSDNFNVVGSFHKNRKHILQIVPLVGLVLGTESCFQEGDLISEDNLSQRMF